MNLSKRKLHILLIEDHTIEVLKFKKTVSYSEIEHTISEAQDAASALEILEASNLPDLILLDLNMPKMNGKEFLTILKKNKRLRHIPIVILTTSDNQKDLEECFSIGISGYVLKPLKYKDYQAKIESVLQYWSINELKRS